MNWHEELTEAQQEPLLIEWIATMEREVAAFRATFLSDFTGDPHSCEAVIYAEKRLLEVFPSREEMQARGDARLIADGFSRFVGEAFVHGLGGRWMQIPQAYYTPEDRMYSVVISTSDHHDNTRAWEMVPIINATVRIRSGMEFSDMWDRTVEAMRENGRDPLTNTTDLIAQLTAYPPLVDTEELSPKRPDNDLCAFLPAGRTVTQAEVRAIFDRQFAGTELVVSEVPFRVVATDSKTRQQIGVVIEIAGTNTAAARYIPMILKGHPHPRKAAFEGATEQLYLYTFKDPREGLAEHLMELAEAFEEEFGALAYLPNAGTYLFD